MTIKDIAKKSGFGVSTVSRALNNHPDISKETKKKILAVVEENNFTLNANAKMLKQRQTPIISIIVKGTKNTLFSSILEIIGEKLEKEQREMSVHYLDEFVNEVLYAEKLYRETKPIGLVFLGGFSDNFEKNFSKIKIPSVLVTHDGSGFNYKNLSSVSTDDVSASLAAIDILVENGHKNIGIIAGNITISGPSRLRLQGAKEAFIKHGLSFDDSIYESARFSLEGGYLATKKLLEKKENLSALFCMSDLMAIGAVRAILDTGKKVPDDISVIGFDGLDIVAYSSPRLNTIKQNVYEIATKSVEILINSIENKASAEHYCIPYLILNGESILRK